VTPAVRARLTAVLVAAACASYGREVDRIRASLVGRLPSQLRECLPVPASFDKEGDTDRVVYRWSPIGDKPGETTLYDAHDETVTPLRRTRELRDFLYKGERPKHHEYCELALELRDARVQAVHVEGRDSQQLKADDRCLMRLRDCVPPEEQDAG
jgi:hypothetical protein